jgi:hypothetical protein
MRRVFTAPYIYQADTYVKPSEEAAMGQDHKTGKVTATIQVNGRFALQLFHAFQNLFSGQDSLLCQ